MEIWNLILESNTFNFVVLVIILAVILHKMNFLSVLENLKENIINRIEMSKSEREKADRELVTAKNAVANLDNEIKESVELTKKNIDAAVKSTLEAAERQAENILGNVKNVVENEEKQVSSKILKSTEVQAVQSAKEKIIARLKATPELHNKYIDEAIQDIEKAAL